MSNSGKYSIYIDPVLFSDESAQASNAGTSRAAFAKSIPTATGYVAYILTTTGNAILACTKFSASETKVINMSTLYDTAVTLSVYAFDETNYASLASVTFTKDNLASCLAKSFAGASNSITKDDFYDGSTSTAIKFTLLPISKNITVNGNSSYGKGSYSLKIKFPLTVNSKAISKVTYPISGTLTNVTSFTGDAGDESNCTITASSTSISVGQQYIYIYFYTKNAASQEVLIKTLPVCLNIWQNLTTEFYQIGNSSALSDTLTLTAADFSATSSAPGSVTADFIEPSGTVASTPISWYASVSDQITSSSSVSTFTDATSSASTFFYSFEGTTAPEQNLKIRFEITTSLSGQSFTFSRQTYTYTSYNASTMSSSLEENFSYTADSTHSSFTIADIVLAAGRNEFILTMKAPDGISTTKYYFCVLNPYAYVTATATNANASDTLTLDSTTNRYSLGSGTNDLPFATVQHAINVFSGANYQRKNKLSSTTTIDTTQYTILVTGVPAAPTVPVSSRYAYYSASDTVYCFDLKIAGTQDDCSKDGLENTASNVGVLYLKGSSTASSNQRMKLTLKDIHLSGGNIPTDNGGGLYASYTDVTLDNVIISKNNAAYGGGIYIYSGTFDMKSGTIGDSTAAATASNYSNHAESGGGIYIAEGSTATISDGAIIAGNAVSTDNTSIITIFGGGIFVASSATLTLTQTTATSPQIKYNICIASKDTEKLKGAGLYNAGTLTIESGTISDNEFIGTTSAYRFGAGILTALGSLTITNKTIGSTTYEPVIDSNKGASYGGGLFVESNSSTATDSYDATIKAGIIKNNTATVMGAGIYVAGHVSITGGTIGGESTPNTMVSGTTCYGAGVCVITNGILMLDGGTISYNSGATYGGGVYVSNNSDAAAPLYGTFTMKSGSILHNSSTSEGGGIYTYGPFSFAGGDISYNSSDYGGGIFIAGNDPLKPKGTMTMSDGTISNNTATSLGGGIYCSYNLTLKGGSISSNTATSGGAGIYFSPVSSDASFSMEGNTVINSNNVVFLSSSNSVQCLITISGALTSTDSVATLVPHLTSSGTKVLGGDSSLISSNYTKFALDSSITGLSIGSDGTLTTP
jgi:predicted outer membrane repeat protein